MAMDVDRAGPMPLYHQIFSVLRAEILDGLHDTGVLPSEQDLDHRFGVSRITIRRALDELERRGLIARSRGRPTRVTTAARRRAAPASLSDDLANLLAFGLETDVTVLDFEMVPASPVEASILGVASDEPILWVERLRSREGEPVCHVALYLPSWVGSHVTRERLIQGPLMAILNDAGIVLDHGSQTISAVAADTHLARLLDVAEGAPLLRLERVVRDRAGSVIEHLTVTFRSDKFTYAMSLESSPEPGTGQSLSVTQAARVDA